MPQFIKLADEYPQFQSQDTDWTWTYALSHIANLCTHITPLYTHSIVFIHINCTLSHWNAVSRLKNSFTNTFSLHRIHCPISTHTHPSRSSVSALVLAFQLCVGVCKQNPEFPTRQRTRSDPISVRLFQGQPLAPFLHNSTLHCLALATLALRREPSY